MAKSDSIGHRTFNVGPWKADIYALLANISTLSNLACGMVVSIAILFFTPLSPELSFRIIMIGGGFDAVDGKLARRSTTKPRLGPQFDTAADQITFATAPALIILDILLPTSIFLAFFVGFLYFFTASFRLSRFMMSPMFGYFTGMPSPVSAYLIVAWYVLPEISIPLFVASAVMISLVMISSLPYSAFRNVRSPYQVFYWIFTVTMMLLSQFGPTSFAPTLSYIWVIYITYFTLVGPKHARHNMRIDDELGISKRNVINR